MKIYDEEDNIHTLGDMLGEGGQGAVYRSNDGDVAIKINSGERSISEFKNSIERVKYTYIDNNDVILPLVLLKKDSEGKELKGYVMRLLDDLVPLKSITPEGANPSRFTLENMPEFLKPLFESNKIAACKIAHYRNTGGLRARLFILKKIACVLSDLHTKGLVYCDLSCNNVFISDELVKFIDADNIAYQSKVEGSIYTPHYEIPEIDKGGKNSLYSDVYAFATLAFYLLTMEYPFIEAKSWDSEISQKIWENEWIDSDNFSGENSNGLRGILSTEPLSDLFKNAFDSGKLYPHKRPIMPIWIESIENALNNVLSCNHCGMDYYDLYNEICPYCDNPKPKRVIVKSAQSRFVKEIANSEKLAVPLSILESVRLDNPCEILFFLELKDNKMFIEKHHIDIHINDKKILARKMLDTGTISIKDTQIHISIES